MSTLRAWERRFHFLEPQRSPAGHRLYLDADVERVEAVLRLVSEGLTLPTAVARVSSGGTAARPGGEGEALLFGQILQVMNQGVWVSLHGRTRYANRKMAELMGCSVDDLLSRPVLDFHRPEELQSDKVLGKSVRAGDRVSFTQQLRRADGSTFLAQGTTTPLFNHAGQYEGAVALVDDVTARTEAETESRFRNALLDSIGEAVLAARPDGTIVYANAAAERLLGWRTAELIGQNGLELLPTQDEATSSQRMHSQLLSKRRTSSELNLTRRDGTQFPAHVAGSPVLDGHGELVGLISVLSDNTERQRLENEVRAQDQQLETIAMLGARALHCTADDAGIVLTEVVEATRRVLQSEHSYLVRVVPGANELVLLASSPHIDELPKIPSGSGSFAGFAVLAGKVVIVGDARRDRRFDTAPGANRGFVSAIAAPMFGPTGVGGVLIAASTEPDKFSISDDHFIQAMANIGSLALRNV